MTANWLLKLMKRQPIMFCRLVHLKTYSDAEEMKAQVAFAGISTNIRNRNKKVKMASCQNKPYAGARKADMVLKELKQNGFKSNHVEDSKPET